METIVKNSLGLASLGLSWYWFDWKLTIILFLLWWTINLEIKNKIEKKD